MVKTAIRFSSGRSRNPRRESTYADSTVIDRLMHVPTITRNSVLRYPV